MAAVAQAVPIDYGYGPHGLVHAAPAYVHGPIAKAIVHEPVVSIFLLIIKICVIVNNAFFMESGIPKILIQLWN